jgi:hypothetical protein
MKINTNTAISVILITLLTAFACQAQNYECNKLNDNIMKYNSLRKSGTVFLVGGIILGTSALILINTGQNHGSLFFPDKNYQNRQDIGAVMAVTGVISISCGLTMTIIGLNNTNKYNKLKVQYNCNEQVKSKMIERHVNDSLNTIDVSQEGTLNSVKNNNGKKSDSTKTSLTEREKEILRQLKSISLPNKQ